MKEMGGGEWTVISISGVREVFFFRDYQEMSHFFTHQNHKRSQMNKLQGVAVLGRSINHLVFVETKILHNSDSEAHGGPQEKSEPAIWMQLDICRHKALFLPWSAGQPGPEE